MKEDAMAMPMLATRRQLLSLFLGLMMVSTFVAADEGNSSAVAIADCAECHDTLAGAFSRNPHSVLDADGWELPDQAAFSCEACHGDVSVHLEEAGDDGTIFAFHPADGARTRSERCLSCHAETHPRFSASSHARAGLACNDCHTVHGAGRLEPTPLLAPPGPIERLAGVDRASAACFSCHPQPFAQFEMNERHRLREGTLGCASCHDPHAPQSRRLLGGFKQEKCITCHTNIGGPFVFEHGASRVEGCTACHDPHGSPNRHLLKFQNVAELCFSCHAEVPQFHFGFNPAAPPRFNLSTQCTNCHSSIHGSNFDPHFLQ